MSAQATGTRISPPDPAGVPGLQDLLLELDLGAWDDGGVRAFGGRNENWAGTTTTGAGVFVKSVQQEAAAEHDEYRRSLAFERLRRSAVAPPRAPQLLGSGGGLLVFSLLPGARTLAELVLDGDLDVRTCRAAGREVASTHAMEPGHAELDVSPSLLPALDWLEALPWSVYGSSSMAQLEALRLMQLDRRLHGPLRALRDLERAAPPRPVHGDLRLDQVLVSDGEVHLCDWEEFRLGDPARDVGTLVGELVCTVALGLVDRDAVLATPGRRDDVLDRGADGLRRVRPFLSAIAAGYRDVRPLDDDTVVRSVRFAGWHLFDRLYVASRERSRLSSLHLAAAGMGRLLLEDPEQFVSTLGLQG